MMEALVSKQIISDEQGTSHILHYLLVSEQIPAGHFFFEEYGVKIEDVGHDSACVYPITHSRSRIEDLLSVLIRHAVTPATLPDVVEDWAKENHLPQPKLQQVAKAQ